MAYKIAVIPGDGTGPEVVDEGLKVLKAVAEKEKFQLDFHFYDLGGERYLKTGEILPETVLEELRKVQAIFLGAIGHPQVKSGILEQGILLRLRFTLDQYINLRPVKLYPGVETPLKDKGPEHINFVIIRENTEGLYTGAGGFLKKGTADEVAVQESINTRKGVERCLRYAFEFCLKRNNELKLTLARQDQRAQLRFRSMGEDLCRGSQGISPRENGLYPRRCPLHVADQKPGVVRRDRDRQPFWRHHHGPGGYDPRRSGHCSRREHQPRPWRSIHV